MRSACFSSGRPPASTARCTSKLEYIKKYQREGPGSSCFGEEGKKRRKRVRRLEGEGGLRFNHVFDEVDVPLPGRPSELTVAAFEAAQVGNVLAAPTCGKAYQYSGGSKVEVMSDPEVEQDLDVVVVDVDGKNVDLSELQNTRVHAILRDQERRELLSESGTTDAVGGRCTHSLQEGRSVGVEAVGVTRRRRDPASDSDVSADCCRSRKLGEVGSITEYLPKKRRPEGIARTTAESGGQFSEETIAASREEVSASRTTHIEAAKERAVGKVSPACSHPESSAKGLNSAVRPYQGDSTVDRDLSPRRRQPQPHARERSTRSLAASPCGPSPSRRPPGQSPSGMSCGGHGCSVSAKREDSRIRQGGGPARDFSLSPRAAPASAAGPMSSPTSPIARTDGRSQGNGEEGETETRDFSPVRRGRHGDPGNRLASSEPTKQIRNRGEEEEDRRFTNDARGVAGAAIGGAAKLLAAAEGRKAGRGAEWERSTLTRDDVTSSSGQVVYRDRQGRIIQEAEWLELQNKGRTKKTERSAAPELEWGRGLVQKEAQEKKAREEEKIARQPLAKYDLDGDYDRKLQETRRWEDPVTQMPKDQVVSTAEPADDKKSKPADGPVCLFDAPRNRFGVLPGYRWDGVVRGNGYEDRRLKAINRKKMEEHLAHLHNVADM